MSSQNKRSRSWSERLRSFVGLGNVEQTAPAAETSDTQPMEQRKPKPSRYHSFTRVLLFTNRHYRSSGLLKQES